MLFLKKPPFNFFQNTSRHTVKFWFFFMIWKSFSCRLFYFINQYISHRIKYDLFRVFSTIMHFFCCFRWVCEPRSTSQFLPSPINTCPCIAMSYSQGLYLILSFLSAINCIALNLLSIECFYRSNVSNDLLPIASRYIATTGAIHTYTYIRPWI